MRTCPGCSTSTNESGLFCPECGSAFARTSANFVANSEAGGSSEAAGGAAPSKEALAASLVGIRVDDFAIEGVLGAGSFATVYRARQVGLDRPVAFKVPTHEIAADPVMAKRFAREARAAARVHHPGVVTIYAVGHLEDDRPYLAMDLIVGESLERVLDDGPLPPVRALGIARQIASALSETHAADVVHRDLKPSNIVWRRDRNGDDRITIVDFGIAVSKPGTADATRLTANGLIGTPHYMSPEQAQGEAVDARSDLYALGVIIFELVTQATPFDGSGYEVLLAHLGRPAPPPSAVNPDVPTVVDDLVLQLLAKRKESRPQSADAVVAAIDRAIRVLEGTSDVRPQTSDAPPAVTPRAGRTSATVRVGGESSGSRARIRRGSKSPPQNTIEAVALDDTGAAPSLSDDDAASAAASVVRPPTSGLEDIGDPMPAPSRARWFTLGALLALVAAAGAVTAWRLYAAPAARPTDDSPAEVTRKEVLLESGEARLRVWIPTPLAAKRSARFRLELRSKLGELLMPDQLVVTVEDSAGKAIGLAARPRSADPSQYGFGHTFPAAGRYLLRIFPPDTSTAFELPVDVQ